VPQQGAVLGMGVDALILAFVVVVIGGLGSLEGALVGALMVGVVREFGITFFPEVELAVLYLMAAVVLLILVYDVWKAFWFTDPATGAETFGTGVGTLVLAVNAFMLSGYLFGCHSMRHIVGGCADQLSRAPLGLKAYSCVSCLNRRHMLWAWTSLFMVGFSDLYVRLCSMGVWTDYRIF